MKRYAVAAALTLSACMGTYNAEDRYPPRGASAEVYTRAVNDCDLEASKAAVANVVPPAAYERIMDSCMAGKGFPRQ